jgi:hypothetical protein
MRRHGYNVVPHALSRFPKDGIDVRNRDWRLLEETVAFINEPSITVAVDQTPMRVLSIANLRLLYAFLARREGRPH